MSVPLPSTLLTAQSISKGSGVTQALDGVTVGFRAGEVHAARGKHLFRIIFAAAALLGLGLVTTVGVAWGCDVAIQRATTPPSGGSAVAWADPQLDVVLIVVPARANWGGDTDTVWTWTSQEVKNKERYSMGYIEPTELEAVVYELRGLPPPKARPRFPGWTPPYHWVQRASLPSDLTPTIARSLGRTDVVMTGWPWRSHYRMKIQGRTSPLVSIGTWNVKGLVIPTLVLVPRLAADAVFYAGAWSLLFFAPRPIRRVRRRRGRRCVKCGYDLAGLVEGVACPECGISRG